MIKRILVIGVLALSIAGLAACTVTDTMNSFESKAKFPSPEKRLAEMSNLFSGVPTLRIETRETHEWTGPSNERSKIEGSWVVTIWRPDALHIKAVSSGTQDVDSELYYDGWTLVYENHSKKIWAWADVPPTIDAMLDQIAWRYNLPIPVADMLYSSPYDALMTDDTKSRFVAKESINGIQCDHFSFSQSSVDWDIWIAAEGKPLPYRLDIVRKNTQVRSISKIFFAAIDLEIKPDSSFFSFEPKKDYTEISVVQNESPEQGTEKSENEGGEF